MSDESIATALDQVVRQWVHAGGGRYWSPGSSTDDVIAGLLVANRPERWERTASGVRWLVG